MVVYRLLVVPLIIALVRALDTEGCKSSLFFGSGCGRQDVKLPQAVLLTTLKSNCSAIATVTLLRENHRQGRKVALQKGEHANSFDPAVAVDALKVWTGRSSCCTLSGQGCSALDHGPQAYRHTYPPNNRHTHTRVEVRNAVSGRSEKVMGASQDSQSIGLVVLCLSVPLILTIALAMGCCHSHQERKEAFASDHPSTASTKELCVRVCTDGCSQALGVLPTQGELMATQSSSISAHSRAVCSSNEPSVDTMSASTNLAPGCPPNQTKDPGNAVPADENTVPTVPADMNTVSTVPADKDTVPTVPADKDTVPTVPADMNTVPTVPADKDTVPTVPADKDTVPTVPADKDTVPTVPADMNTVPTVPADKDTVPTVPADMNTVPTVPADMNTVPTVPADKDTVPTAPADMNTVPTVPADMNTVPTVPADMNTVPTVPADMNTVPTVPADMNTVPDPEKVLTTESVVSDKTSGLLASSNDMQSGVDAMLPVLAMVPCTQATILECRVLDSESVVHTPVTIPEPHAALSPRNTKFESTESVTKCLQRKASSQSSSTHNQNPSFLASDRDHLVLGPENSVPNPEQHSVLNPESMAPDPENSVPNPENSVPNPEDLIPNPENAIPNSENSVPNPENSIPNSENFVPNPENSIPNPENSIPNPENSIPSLEISESIVPNPNSRDLNNPLPNQENSANTILPRSVSLLVINDPITGCLISRTSFSAPDLSIHAPDACMSHDNVIVCPVPEPEILVRDFIDFISNQASTAIPASTGTLVISDLGGNASDQESLILDPECLVSDFMRLVCGLETPVPDPDSPVHVPSPQPLVSHPVKLVSKSAGCLLTYVMASCVSSNAQDSGVPMVRSASLPALLPVHGKRHITSEGLLCANNTTFDDHTTQDICGPHLPCTPAQCDNLLPPDRETESLLSPTSKAPEEPLYDTVKSCTESADYLDYVGKPYWDTPGAPKEPIYHILEKPRENNCTGSQFGSTESIATVTESQSSWSSEDFDEPVYQAPSERCGSAMSGTSEDNGLYLPVLQSSSHVSRSSSRAGSCRHVSTPPPTVRCSVEPYPEGSPTPPVEDEQPPPLPCPRKPAASEHIYEMLKPSRQLSCKENKMLTEEEVEISCQKKRHRMVVALGSDHSSRASSSSCETLATSPMYINPDTVDFFSTGSLDARGTFLEPPGKCDLWNGRRSSVPGPKKSFYPVPAHDLAIQQPGEAAAINPVLPQVALSVEEVWLSQQENLYAPLTFVKTSSLRGPRHKPEEVGWYEKPVQRATSGCGCPPLPHHAALNKTSSFSYSDRNHTDTSLPTSL